MRETGGDIEERYREVDIDIDEGGKGRDQSHNPLQAVCIHAPSSHADGFEGFDHHRLGSELRRLRVLFHIYLLFLG